MSWCSSTDSCHQAVINTAGPHLGVDKFIPANPIQVLASTLTPVFLLSHWLHSTALKFFT